MKRRDEVMVGVFTTVAVLIGVLGAIWLARGGLSPGYPLYAKFPWGSGLKQGQPVWLVGVTVGFVDHVELDPNGTLTVAFRIQKQYHVPLGTKAQVVANGLFGDMAIALTPDKPNPLSFAAGDTVPVGPPVAGISTLVAGADTVSNEIKSIISAARVQLVDSAGIAEMRQTILSSNRLVAQLSQIAALQSRELQATMGQLRRTVSAVDSTQVDSTVRNLRATAENMTEVSAELKNTTTRMNALLAKVENGEGTAAKLLNDPGLYADMRRLLTRVDSLTLDIKVNPRKYINLSIF